MRHRTTLLLALIAALGTVGAVMALGRPAEFSHRTHTRLFPASCTTCHAGAADPAQSIWPTATSCAACHDGEAEARVEWSARTTPPATNLRFAHATHARETADSVGCAACHVGADPRGEVHLARASQCISCHVPGGRHHSVPDRECATCHVPLAEATRLADLDVARIRAPASHRDSTFRLERHGRLAIPTSAADGRGVARSCATCHARNFCINCHVNAPEVAAIQALAPDPRSLLHDFTFGAPASHAAASFLTAHGREASRSPARCATCHTRPSCAACHAAPLPRGVAALPTPAPGRAVGAVVERRPPPSHTVEFREGHGTVATATPRSCSTCHARQECLACHRGTVAQGGGGDYHPTDFITRHPVAAYGRQVSCSDCHNTQQFCASCHRQAGLGGGNTLGGASYHDSKAAFFVGHGQAARQSLESCVSCHAERDCTACHSAIGGRRFSPHGPGFDAERLRRRNPEMCIACHGRAIPGG